MKPKILKPAKKGKIPIKVIKAAVKKVTEQRVLQGGFSDNRAAELRGKLDKVIEDYAAKTGMTYAVVVGILQMMCYDLYEESKD